MGAVHITAAESLRTVRFLVVFEDFRVLEKDMLLVSSPFTFNVENAPTDLQLERIDLQSDTVIGELFKTMSLTRF